MSCPAHARAQAGTISHRNLPTFWRQNPSDQHPCSHHSLRILNQKSHNSVPTQILIFCAFLAKVIGSPPKICNAVPAAIHSFDFRKLTNMQKCTPRNNSKLRWQAAFQPPTSSGLLISWLLVSWFYVCWLHRCAWCYRSTTRAGRNAA